MKATTLTQVEWWLNNLAQGIEYGACQSPGFLKPFHMLTLVSEVKRHKQYELALPPDLTSYAARMQLWEAAGLEPPYAVPKRSELGRFLPVAPLKSEQAVDESVDQLSRIIRSRHMSNESVESLSVTLFELLMNCFNHAAVHDELHGLACAQPWTRANLGQIAIVDCGIGIRGSLELNLDLALMLEQLNACDLASRYGITSKPGKGHSGYGLTLARDLMQQAKGSFILVSGQEAFWQCDEKEVSHTMDVGWDGTLIILEWPLNTNLNSKGVYENWPLPEGFDKNDFDF